VAAVSLEERSLSAPSLDQDNQPDLLSMSGVGSLCKAKLIHDKSSENEVVDGMP
jgi:hypothetical protein